MTTDLEQRLREALHEDADRARLVNPDGPPDFDVPMTIPERRRGAPVWLAVAAVLAVVVLLSALVLLDDDQNVDTTPATVPEPRTMVAGPGCPFGISGEPIEMLPGPVDPLAPRFDTEPRQGVAHTIDGEQVAEIRVPGFEVTQVEDWRIEPIELERGPATVWLDGPPSGEAGKPFVQVRFFPGTDELCSSFTVTVDGGTEDENLQVAVDLAERIVLPSELGIDVTDLPEDEGTTTTAFETGVGMDTIGLPEVGEQQPPDAPVADEQVRAAFTGIFDFSQPREARDQLSERPAVWLAANEMLTEGQYGDSVHDMYALVDEVVFTDATHASVRFQLLASDPVVPRDHVGEAVLVDGRWLVSISTTCDLVSMAGVVCDMTL